MSHESEKFLLEQSKLPLDNREKGRAQFQSGSRERRQMAVHGIGVAAREAGTSESQDGKNLG